VYTSSDSILNNCINELLKTACIQPNQTCKST